MLAGWLAGLALGSAGLPAHAPASVVDPGAAVRADVTLTPAEARLADQPDCDPQRLFCAQGQAGLLDIKLKAHSHQSAQAVDALCPPGRPKSKACLAKISAVLKEVFRADEAGLRWRALDAASTRAWAAADLDHVAERPAALAGAQRLFEAEDCPRSSKVCTLGRWVALNALTEQAVFRYCDNPSWVHDAAQCKLADEAALAWIGSEALALLSQSGWPDGAGEELVERVADRLHDRPAFWSQVLPLWKAARRAGRASSYAGTQDAALRKSGQKQINGTLGDCTFEGGPARWEPEPIQDEAHLDLRRAAAGEAPMREWLARQTRWCETLDPRRSTRPADASKPR